MPRYLILVALPLFLALFLAGCQQTLSKEPPMGKLPFGKTVLVDDGTCPSGEIKQVTGGNASTPRKRDCIPVPE